jgi:hypothetical protein
MQKKYLHQNTYSSFKEEKYSQMIKNKGKLQFSDEYFQSKIKQNNKKKTIANIRIKYGK